MTEARLFDRHKNKNNDYYKYYSSIHKPLSENNKQWYSFLLFFA